MLPLLDSWFTNPETSGGPLIDIGAHVLDSALFLLGEPRMTSVNAVTYAEFGHRDIGESNRVTVIVPGSASRSRTSSSVSVSSAPIYRQCRTQSARPPHHPSGSRKH